MVLSAQARMKAGDYPYPDDDILLIPAGGNPGAGGGGGGSLIALDPSIAALMSTARPEKLLKNDGSIATQIVKSVAVAEPALARTNRAFDTGTKVFTFKSFLSANAVRATDARDGIDHCSTNNSTTCAVGSITVPVMIVAMGAYQFIRDDELDLRQGAEQGQGLPGPRRRRARLYALHGLRDDAGAVLQQREEPVRLHSHLDR